MTKRIIGTAALLIVPLIAVLAVVGMVRWDIASAAAAFLCCVSFFASFEGRAPSARELVLVACMTAFSSAGRLLFAQFPFFKPVAAIVIISGMYFGKQAGFMTGALSALISNIYFGQGSWTPFQMLCWGGIGFLAGVFNRKHFLERAIPLCIFGFFAGIGYSIVMDVWTTLSVDGTFSFARWLSAIIAAIPVTVTYSISDIIFLLILRKPIGKRLERLKTKYGVFSDESTD